MVAGFVEFGLEGFVGGLECQDRGDSGQVEAVVEQLSDLAQADEVVEAIPAGTALTAGRADQAACFIQSEVLRGAPDQLRGHRDPVHAAGRLRQLAAACRCHHEIFLAPVA
jgi:hypothetical protein